MVSTYLAIDLKKNSLSFIFKRSLKLCGTYCPNLSNYKCLGRSASISVSPYSNPNSENAETTAFFLEIGNALSRTLEGGERVALAYFFIR